MDMLSLSQKRFTSKAYDPEKKISDTDFNKLTSILQNCPSSVNSQPWHFIVVNSDKGKETILPGIKEFNHEKVKNSSHTIIFCVRTELSDSFLTELLKQEELDGRFPQEQFKLDQDRGRRFFVGKNSETPQSLYLWGSKQVYLALGTLLYGAASLNIHATPIEGFDSVKMDGILELKEKGLTSVVVAALGYNSDMDFNAHLPKSRLPKEKLFTYL